MIRPRPFLTYFVVCAIPLLLLAGLNYWNGLRTVDSTIGAVVQNDLNSFNVAVDHVIHEQESAILRLAMTPDVQQIVAGKNEAEANRLNSLLDLSPYFQSLTLFDHDRQPLSFRIANSRPGGLQPDQRVWGLQG